MDRKTEPVCTAVDAVTVALIRDLLASGGIAASARGFDGETI
jgi:hypothetical protein